MKIIDISIPLSSNLPTWPGGYGLSISRLQIIDEQNPVNVSKIDFDVHSGTHIDAPLHFVNNGKTTNEIPLENLIGECLVVEISENKNIITAKDLDQLNFVKSYKKILFKTSNSFHNLWSKSEFDNEYCALSSDGAEWIVQNMIELIGIDYCSIQKFHDSIETHQILLNNNVIILEGLDLRNVNPGVYNLICLPISVDDVEGVPVRAILTLSE
jgi:arylformamidase